MDRICSAVFDKIRELSPMGRYVIVAEDEFYDGFPEDGERSYKELDRALSVLKNGGFIDIKYSRGDMYCVAPLKDYVDEIITPAPAAKTAVRKIDMTFISAFAGSALGSLIISLIFALAV